MSEKEVLLVTQLASALKYLMDGEIDYEVTSNLRNSTENPDTFKPSIYFGAVNRVIKAFDDGVALSWSEAIDETVLKRSISIGGRGRRDILNGELAKRGVSVSTSKELPKPTLYDKVFRQEIVKQYEKQEAENLELE